MHRSVLIGSIVFLLALLLACGTPTATGPTITAATAPAVSGAATSAPDAPTAAEAPTDAPTAAEAPTVVPEPTAAAAPTIGHVGDRIEQSGAVLTVVKVSKTAKIGDLRKAQAGNTFVVLEVLVENTSDTPGDYNPFYFKVKDDSGFEYTATINLDPQALKSGNLAKGEKARGTVVFEVKKDAKGLILSYQPLALSLSGAAIKVALE